MSVDNLQQVEITAGPARQVVWLALGKLGRALKPGMDVVLAGDSRTWTVLRAFGCLQYLPRQDWKLGG